MKVHIKYIYYYKFETKLLLIRPKKKTSLFPVAGLKIAMRNAFFFFFFTIHEKAMRNAVFIFLNKTSGRKYIKTIALVSFQHLLRTLPVSYQNDLCDHLFYMHSVHL